MKKIIKEQIEFVEWLKSKGIYNQFASDNTMQSMFRVYQEMKKQNLGA